MSRVVEGSSQGEPVEYVPESFDNRSDPEPMRITFTEPTEGERRAMAAAAQSEIGDVEDIAKALEFQRRILSERVTCVSNYEVRGKTIVDGDSLASFGESEVVAEVFGAVMYGNRLSEEESKN